MDGPPGHSRKRRVWPPSPSPWSHQKSIVLGGLAEVSDKGLTVLADVATSMQDLDRGRFADKIADMEAKLAEKEGSELDRAVERLDHFKSIQHQLNSTAMH